MNTKVLARYFSALRIINNGLNWWKRFSYDWIGLFSQDKLDNGDEIKFHYVSDIDRIRYHTWTDCWGGPYPDCAIHWKDRWTELIEKNIWQIAT